MDYRTGQRSQRWRRGVLIALMVVTAGGTLFAALPAGAARLHALDPQQLALPQSALPAGGVLQTNTVSDNADADKSNFHVLHPNSYESLGRITGYHQIFTFPLQGSTVGTDYLASEFGSASQATAAMNESIGPNSLVAIIGKPLGQPCTAGDACQAYYGTNPLSPTNKVVFGVFVRGPILVETASQVAASTFDQLEPSLETALYGLLDAADSQAKLALGETSATNTPAPTATNTPLPTATPKPKAKSKPKHVTCKKGYKLVKGKCKKAKKKKGP